MVCKTQRNSINPFLTRNIARLLCTSGFNVKVSKFCIFFYKFQKNTVRIGGKERFAENFNPVSLIIKRTEQYEFCMQIACKKSMITLLIVVVLMLFH